MSWCLTFFIYFAPFPFFVFVFKVEKPVTAYRDLECISEHDSASLERTVVSVNKSQGSLDTAENGGSLNDTPSEPDGLEDAREVSCSEADTTASSSFTTSPVAVSSFYAKSDGVSCNVDQISELSNTGVSSALVEFYFCFSRVCSSYLFKNINNQFAINFTEA